jgi:serine/threonine-protein kinase HipA
MSQIFRRAVFNVMSVNRDDHAKNFSFLLHEDGHRDLAPGYDITHSNWGASWTQTQYRGRILIAESSDRPLNLP